MSTCPPAGGVRTARPAPHPLRRPTAASTAWRQMVVLCAALGTLASVVGAAPARAAAVDQTYWIPVDKQITVRGHGFGHGHGMSQYGAYGAARQGLTHREILDFYYPGTSWGTVRGLVRVLITADTSSDVVVSPAPGLSVRDLGAGTTYPVPALSGVKRWRLNVNANGDTVVGYLTDRWRRWAPGGRTTLVGDGQFSAREPLRLWTPTGSRTYRGILRAASPTPGSSVRDTVNVVSMDDYVRGVIPYEMPASWSTEAVRSQAVAARTYAAWSRAQAAQRYYQICDTTSCQVYGGVDGEDPRSNDAVTATARRILTYDDRPAFTQFSSSSGGWTSAGSAPYLTARADPYDGHSANPVHDWTVQVDAGRLERSYPAIGTLLAIRVVQRDGNGDWQGRVGSLVLDGSQADRTISGDSFRWAFGLRSSWFTIEPTAIMQRWKRLGGNRSALGQVRSPEYAVDRGAAQGFSAGRIYYSRAVGARELLGAIATRFRGLGGPARSGLGWPVRGNYPVSRGERADFQHGTLTWIAATGRVRVVRH